jgi:hypothetical protein
MDATAIVTVGTAVSAAVELFKRAGLLPSKYALAVVVAVALLFVALWAWTSGDFSRATAFGYVTGWIAIATTSVGVYEGVSRTGAAIAGKTDSAQ